MDAHRQQAETLRSELALAQAIRIAESIVAESDIRLQHLKPWAETFCTEVLLEKERQDEFARGQMSEAAKHREVYDYAAAIHAVEKIPKPMRTLQISNLLNQLKDDETELSELVVSIADCIKQENLDGLLEKVNRARELDGNRQDLEKLQKQLPERQERQAAEQIFERDVRYSEAEKWLSEGKAKEALAHLSGVRAQNLRPSDVALLAKLKEICAAESALTKLVTDCKADGVIEPHELVQMFISVTKYLEMNPMHSVVNGLRSQLIAMIVKTPEKCLTEFAVKAPGILPTLFSEIGTKLPPTAITKLPPLVNSIEMHLKLIPAGKFQMGEGKESNEVTLTRPFYLGVYEVTQEQYELVMRENPSHFKGEQNPVEQVSWNDAVAFCQKLSALPEEKAAGRVYRLPTEAEWEYACRAGTTTAYSFGNNESELDQYAWYLKKSDSSTHPVGQKKANPWGLYDMHGNVWEWCQDLYGDYPSGAVTNPEGASRGFSRVFRSGGWCNGAAVCRSAVRREGFSGNPYNFVGFRLALSPSGKKGFFSHLNG